MAQAAGLAARGHQEQVRPRVNIHGKRLVIAKMRRHPPRVLSLRPREKLLELLLSLSQHHHLHGKLHDVVEHLPDEVQPLVGRKAAHHRENRRVRLLPQAHQLLQLRLVGGLAGQIGGGVVFRKQRVRGGVVPLHVDAVEHAGELIGAPAHHALHPVGKIGVFQLLGIGGGHGGHCVGAEDGPLQKIHVPIHHDGAVVHPAGVQPKQIPRDLRPKPSLIFDVVDGHDGAHGAIPLFPHAVVLQINGDEGALPVVAVNHVGPKGHMGQHPHHRPGEKAKPLSVVHIAVQIRAVKILLVVQEIIGHFVPHKAKQPAIAPPPRQIHIVVAKVLQLRAKLIPDAPVQRQHHSHLSALRRHRGGQGAGHVGQSSGFAERHGLAGGIQNFHGGFPFLTQAHTSKPPASGQALHPRALAHHQWIGGVPNQRPVRKHLHSLVGDDMGQIRVAADHGVLKQNAVAHPRTLLHHNAGEQNRAFHRPLQLAAVSNQRVDAQAAGTGVGGGFVRVFCPDRPQRREQLRPDGGVQKLHAAVIILLHGANLGGKAGPDEGADIQLSRLGLKNVVPPAILVAADALVHQLHQQLCGQDVHLQPPIAPGRMHLV
ncbi:hypothetical protein SDC9_96564 [bioreactor metagenome]|uniref:Uncharacterized protein n=1 Tax=bioreactor metagenome TaxID=1076179 RepID=A0A645A9M0_9ZZZZ